MKNNFYSNYSLTNIYKKKSLRSDLVTQMLYGEKFRIIKKYKKFWEISLTEDCYKGYIAKKKFLKNLRYDYKVSSLKANIYSGPSLKKIIKQNLTFASRLTFLEKKGSFLKFEKNKWIKISDVKKNKYKMKNIFSKIKIFKKVKYLWGGKSYKGVDCSSLIQLFFNFNNLYFPRDSKDQEKYVKKKIKINNIKKNDLFFWKSHVAIVISKNNLIHAYGPAKKVIIMNTNKTIREIKENANLKVTSIKRI